jgi:hypothetical protein
MDFPASVQIYRNYGGQKVFVLIGSNRSNPLGFQT